MAEAALIAGIACAVVWWVLRVAPGARRTSLAAGLAIGLLLLGWAVLAPRRVPLEQRDAQKRPLVLGDAGYVSSNVCISCHPGEHATWDASHHSAMTQLATPATVLGVFSGQTLAWEGRIATLERRGDEFWVHLKFFPGTPDALDETRRVLMTTGSRLFQVYWTSTNEGRDIERLPFVYLIEEQRWIPLDAAFLLPASQEIELTSWERNCSACHTTNPRPRHVVRDAQASELGIACEACHGPGSEHVEHYGDLPTRYLGHFAEEAVAIVNPAKLDHIRSSQVCGQCHAVRYVGPTEAKAFMRNGYTYRPGDDLQDTSLLVTYPPRRNDLRRLVEGDPKLRGTPLAEIEDRVRLTTANQSRFWPDGMVRVTGAEYSGLLATACYQRGSMSCLSCHTLHKAGDDPRPVEVWVDDQLGPGMEGDAASAMPATASTRRPTRTTPRDLPAANARTVTCPSRPTVC
jgi:hypothetical protein